MPATKLTITPDTLARAAELARLPPGLAAGLWSELEALAPRRRFDAANVAFYFGAMVIFSAMTWFLTQSWDATSGAFKTGAALVYATIFGGASYALGRAEQRVPSGLLATAAVCMTPLAVFGIESSAHVWTQGDPGSYSGFYEYVKGSWIFMELATVAVGLLALRVVRFPFLTAPIAFALWYLSMDLAPLLFDTKHFAATWDERAAVSTAVGLAMIAVAFAVDRFTREDYAFWLYLFGSTSFWCGLWARYESSTESSQFVTFSIALAFIGVSVLLGRRALAVYGGFGAFAYVGHLAWFFRDSFSFPVLLSAGGLAIIGLGLAYQKYLPRLERAAQAAIPATVRGWIPRSRA